MGKSAAHAKDRGLWSRTSPDKSELSKRIEDWTAGPEEKPGCQENFCQSLELTANFQDSPKTEAFKAALREHLEEHPDLAADPEKILMLRYCLYTYCRIHPDFADFTLKARVREASRMAGQFLNQLNACLNEHLR
ncbi:MAG: hypothetical protein QME75_02515 [Deltaproteobacteria bacterium]|nr:hypothetical protein [Deltaproteobacteria bacterium]